MYDVVVVGAGSAGCVVAARLSEDGRRRVLLLEDGPADGGSARLGDPPDPEWNRETVVETAGRTLPYRQGRGVGGSSAVNGAVAIRPAGGDFAGWPGGWQWDVMLPVLRRIECDLDYGSSPWHGDSGPIPLTRYPEDAWGPVHLAFRDACQQAGFPVAADLNAPGTHGFGPTPMNRIDGTRVSMAAAYLEPALGRSNLELRSDASVARIGWTRGGRRRASGVVLSTGEVIGCGDVVVCAGAVQSPLLLQRSGVAQPAVGSYLSDHFFVEVATPIDEELVPPSSPTSQTMLRVTDETGAICLHLAPFAARTAAGARLGVRVALQDPVGSGTVESGEVPRLRWPFLDQPKNVERLRVGWRLAADLVAASGVSADSYGLSRDRGISDRDLDRSIVATHLPFFHACGTCGLGRVVDDECRLVDADGVRIVDASVIPRIPRANIHLTVIAVAERAADLMLT